MIPKSRSKSFFVSLGNLLLIAILLWWFLYLGEHRLIARDEGFYAMAAKLMALGYYPYTDFFFPQGPMSALSLSWLYRFLPVSWDTARFLASLLGFASTLFLWMHCKVRYGLVFSYCAVALTCCCNLYFTWLTTMQTYPFVTVFLLGSVILLYTEKTEELWGPAPVFLSGLSLAFAILSRVNVALLIVPCISIFLLKRKSNYRSALLFFVGGLSLPLLTFALFFTSDFDRLWFNIVEYHLLRSDTSFSQSFEQKSKILAIISGLAPTAKYSMPHVPVLFFLTLATSVFRLIHKRNVSFFIPHLLTLIFVSIIPTPSYVQYFCILVPFLVLTSIDNMYICIRGSDTRSPLGGGVLLACFALSVYFVCSVSADLKRYTTTGKGVIGIYTEHKAAIWNTEYTKRVSSVLSNHIQTGTRAFSFWPGYLLETPALPLAGFENHFAPRIAHKLSAAQQERFRVGGHVALQQAITNGTVSAVIIDPQKESTELKTQLAVAGFERDPQVQFPAIYLLVKDN